MPQPRVMDGSNIEPGPPHPHLLALLGSPGRRSTRWICQRWSLRHSSRQEGRDVREQEVCGHRRGSPQTSENLGSGVANKGRKSCQACAGPERVGPRRPPGVAGQATLAPASTLWGWSSSPSFSCTSRTVHGFQPGSINTHRDRLQV